MIRAKGKATKWLVIAASAFLVSAIFAAGCSNKGNGGAGTDDFVEISWYMSKPIDNEKDQAVVEEEANKAFKEKINAKLRFNLIDNAGWEDKIKLMSGAGEAYDLVFTSTYSNRLYLNVQRGAFLPLDDLLEKYGQDIKKKVDPRAWKAVTYNGKIMAIPAQTPYTQPIGFVFKKELVDKYQFNYKNVKTLKDLEPFLQKLKENEPNITPIMAFARGGMAGVALLDYGSIIDGVVYDEKNGKPVLTLDVPDYVDHLRTVNDFYRKGYIAKDAAVKTDFLAEAKSGKYGVLKDSGGYTEDGSKSTALFGYPTVESLYGYPIISTDSMIQAATAISKTSKNPDRAMMLLNLIWQDKKLSNTLAYGLEGKHYTVKAGQGTDNPTIEAKSGAEQTWAIWHNWLGPLWDQWDSNWNSTKALEAMKKNNDAAQTSALLGFSFNTEPVKAEIAQVSAVFAEIKPILLTGSMPDFDKYIEDAKRKLNDAGMDKIVIEIQKQIDVWKEANK